MQARKRAAGDLSALSSDDEDGELELPRFVWTVDALTALTRGTLVWGRYRAYPFWPGMIEEVLEGGAGDDGKAESQAERLARAKVKVVFFGDDSCERVNNVSKNLRPFRSPEFEEFEAEGLSHYLADTFRDGLKQALDEEAKQIAMVAAAAGTGAGAAGGVELPSGPAFTRAQIRRLGRRAGQQQQDDADGEEGVRWTPRQLRLLKVGTIVWYQLKGYPFWPARIDAVESADVKNGQPKLSLYFFGDGAREKAKNFEENMYLFRCRKYEVAARTAPPSERSTP